MKKVLSVMLIAVLMFTAIPFSGMSAFAGTSDFAGGSGTAEDPYLISTKKHLDNVRFYLSAHFKMIDDIVFAEEDFTQDGFYYNGGLGWEPIGYTTDSFSGVFDGNNHTIANIFINNTNDFIGLFGTVSGSTAKVQNVYLSGVQIKGNNYVGGIAGRIESASISGCYVEGKIIGETYVGGIVGATYYTSFVTDCLTEGGVNGITKIGGICGVAVPYEGETSDSYVATISNCQNKALLTGTSIIGGIVGEIMGACSYDTRWVYKPGSSTYGYYVLDWLAPKTTNISNCFNAGNISGDGEHCSGIAGKVRYSICSYTESTYYYAKLSNCYNVGNVTSSASTNAIVMPLNYLRIDGCYYLTGCATTADNGVEKSNNQMRTQSSFTEFDFDTVWTMGGDAEYLYPELRCFVLSGNVGITGKVEYASVVTPDLSNVLKIDKTFTYNWYVNGEKVATTESYSILPKDVGQKLALEIVGKHPMNIGGLVSDAINVEKAQQPEQPVVPELQSINDNCLKITTVSTQEYSIDNTNWQTSGIFENLEPNKEYTVYSRILENDLYLLGESKAVLSVTTERRPLSGVVNIVGVARYGDTLEADTTAVKPQGATFSYEWKRGDQVVGTDSTYKVVKDDIGENIILSVKGVEDYIGTLTSASVTGIKASVQQPGAPVVEEVSNTSIKLATKTGYEYSKDKVTWQDSPLFENLSVATEYTFYQRIKETDTVFASKSSDGTKAITLKNSATAPQKPVVENVTNVSVTLKYAPNYEYSLDGVTWQQSNVFSGLNPNEEYFFCQRTAENETTYASSQSAYTAVTTLKNSVNAPSAPIIQEADDGSVTLQPVEGFEYSKNGTTWQKSNEFSGLDALQTYTFYQRVAETETDYASPSSAGTDFKVKYVPSKPLPPVLQEKNNDRIEVVSASGYQYSLDKTNWRTGGIFTGLQPNKTYTIYCRTPETDTYYASESSEALIVTTLKNTASKPVDAPVVSGKTDSTVSLEEKDDYEFSKDGISWQSSPVFDGLSPNTEYTFYQRTAETDITYASPSSNGTSVRTDKKTLDIPSAPTLFEKTATSIALTKIDGYEYSMDGVEWQADNTFADLLPNTEYTFYQRIAETDISYASLSSSAFSVTTEKYTANTPKAPIVIATTPTVITLAPYSGYEYSMDGVEWQVDHRFTGLLPDTTYQFCQRIAETDDTYASVISEEVQGTTSAKRTCSISPRAPVIARCTTNSISLVAIDGYEYSRDGINWQDSPEFSGLSSDKSYTFYQRIKETAEENASDCSAGTTATTLSLSSGTTSATNYDRLRALINQKGATNSSGVKTIVKALTAGSETWYYALENQSSGIKFVFLTSGTGTRIVGTTEFLLKRDSKYISAYCSLLYYYGSSLVDSVADSVSIDRSKYSPPQTEYTLYDSGKYLDSADLTDRFNSTLEMLCDYFDIYLYSEIGLGLENLGFRSFSGKGSVVCDSPSSYHTGRNVTRYARESLCTIDGYTGDVYCSACNSLISSGTVISAVGSHEYSNTCDKNCNVCGEERRIEHDFDGACDAVCNVCEAERNVAEHTYDNVCDDVCNECNYKRMAPHQCDDCEDLICNVCGKTREYDHPYISATCTDPKTCPLCQATEGEALGHKYDNNCDITCNKCGEVRTITHTYTNACDTTCNICQAPRTVGPHQYTNACDTSCNICGAIRSISHSYSNACDTSCNVCGATRTVAGHKYTNACDTTCNICQAPRTVGPHQYSNACDTGCNICGATRTVAGHKYTNACDTSCDYCGATRSISHSYSNTCDTSCNVCGATRSITHSYGSYVYNNDATAAKDGTKTRTCSVCGAKDTVTAVGTKIKNPFTDVKAGEYYTDPVLWAVGKGITNGTSATTFSPNAQCTRGQIVTFLWRAAGSPEPQSTRNPFTDVKRDQYYYKAVLWAVEKGITNGTSATTFSPNATCTRGQVVTFLWRAKGKPSATASTAFTDVKKGQYYTEAVAWAVKNGITTGISATQFAPDATCTRGQIVTFLYRAYK